MSAEPGRAATAAVDRLVRLVPDFPKPGVLFRDITPLLADGPAFASVVRALADAADGPVDAVAGIEARGFLLAAPVAVTLGTGLIAVRKASKLPPPVLSEEYALEYGTATLELSPHAIRPGARVLLVDDVLATGGTAAAACRLLEDAGAQVTGLAFLIELIGLAGRAAVPGRPVHALVSA